MLEEEKKNMKIIFLNVKKKEQQKEHEQKNYLPPASTPCSPKPPTYFTLNTLSVPHKLFQLILLYICLNVCIKVDLLTSGLICLFSLDC